MWDAADQGCSTDTQHPASLSGAAHGGTPAWQKQKPQEHGASSSRALSCKHSHEREVAGSPGEEETSCCRISCEALERKGAFLSSCSVRALNAGGVVL